MHTMYEQQKETLDSANRELMKICAQLYVKYEVKCLALLVTDAKLMAEQESADARIMDMRKELAMMQYKVSMGEEKVRRILLVHKEKMLKLVVDIVNKDWKTWSAQAQIVRPIVSAIYNSPLSGGQHHRARVPGWEDVHPQY